MKLRTQRGTAENITGGKKSDYNSIQTICIQMEGAETGGVK